jgi:hypothetical protein
MAEPLQFDDVLVLLPQRFLHHHHSRHELDLVAQDLGLYKLRDKNTLFLDSNALTAESLGLVESLKLHQVLIQLIIIAEVQLIGLEDVVHHLVDLLRNEWD